jgi:queuine tRNA-ribosyltransferase
MHATMAAVAPRMPDGRPRYVMGIGTPHDLLAAVSSGVDMFDCVMPTRHARNGQFFTFAGRLNIRQARFRDDEGPVDPTCGCRCCRRYSRAYLRHLHEQNEPLYGRLATIHNLFFYHQWVWQLRRALREGRFAALAREYSSIISAHYADFSQPDSESADDPGAPSVGSGGG